MKKIFLVLLAAACLAGCATTVRYMSYTGETYPPKPGNYFVTVFTASQHIPVGQPYRVIGKVEIQGYASDGVTPGMLMDQAESIARRKGADAIINANTVSELYTGTYVIPGHYGYYYYHPARYIPYQNSILQFTADLVVYTPHP
jgi:hypothetical protein